MKGPAPRLRAGAEPLADAGDNVLTRNAWLRAYDNEPYVDLGTISPNIMANSTIDGAYGWEQMWSGKSADSGVLRFDETPQYFPAQYREPTDAGQAYRITGACTSMTEGSFRLQFDDTHTTSIFSAIGDFDEIITAPEDDMLLSVSPRGEGSNTFDLVNIEVTVVRSVGTVGLAAESGTALAPDALLAAPATAAIEAATALPPPASLSAPRLSPPPLSPAARI